MYSRFQHASLHTNRLLLIFDMFEPITRLHLVQSAMMYSVLVLLVCLCAHVYPIITPPDEYSVEAYFKMAARQKDFVLDALEVTSARINPSIIRDPHNKDRILMVWRKGRERNSKIGYMWTDTKSWDPHRDTHTVEILDKNITKPGHNELIGEDPRISTLNGRIIISYNTHRGKFKTFHYSSLYYHQQPAHLVRSHDQFGGADEESPWESAVTKRSEILYILPSEQRNVVFEADMRGDIQRHQKNWSPFEYCPLCVYRQGSVSVQESGHYRAHLLFSYSLQPHIIVQAHGMQATSEAAATQAEKNDRYHNNMVSNAVAETVFATEMLPEFEWQWGEMRGGTPALLVGDSYLAFFHSSGRLNHKTVISYVMGAYLFQREPPFAITHMSPEPIVHPSMVNETLGWAYKVVDYIVFPMGFAFDDQHLYLSYGKNDKSSWVLKFEKEGLLASLRPVKSRVLGSSAFDKVTGNIERHTYKAATGS